MASYIYEKAIQQQALHTNFLVNKETYGSKSTIQTL